MGLLQNKLLVKQVAMRSLQKEMKVRLQKFQILTLEAWQLRLTQYNPQ